MNKAEAILSRLGEISRNQKDPALDIAFTPRARASRTIFQRSLRTILDALDAYHPSTERTNGGD